MWAMGHDGVLLRQHHLLLRREDGSGLGHEVYPAKDDHLGVQMRGCSAQLQGIAHQVRNILNLRNLVVVGQDDRLTLLLQRKNLIYHSHRDGKSFKMLLFQSI